MKVTFPNKRWSCQPCTVLCFGSGCSETNMTKTGREGGGRGVMEIAASGHSVLTESIFVEHLLQGLNDCTNL